MTFGAMTPERWAEYYNGMVAVGVYPPGLAIEKAYVTTFVNRRVGIDLKK